MYRPRRNDGGEVRSRIPATCQFWLNGRCNKTAQVCSFLHGYICRNDGNCTTPNCNDIHFKKNGRSTDTHWRYKRYSRSRSRSMSPRGHRDRFSRQHGGRTPPRRYQNRSQSRSPRRRFSRSPRRRISRSPRRSSRSRTRSPRRSSRSRTRSPRRLSRSRTRSPRRRSNRSRSISPRRHYSKNLSRSPLQRFSRSKSPVKPSSRCRSRSISRSHERDSTSSSSISPKELRSQTNSPKTNRTQDQYESPGLNVLDRVFDETSNKKMAPVEILSEVSKSGNKDVECISLDSNSDKEIKVLSPSAKTKESSDAHQGTSISKASDPIATDFMTPETQALLQKILKRYSKDEPPVKETIKNVPSPEPVITEKFLDDMAEDLEDGDEMFSFIKGDKNVDHTREGAANPSPPKPKKQTSNSRRYSDDQPDYDYHTDWELKQALENPEKPLERNIPLRPPPLDKSNLDNKSKSLWTPALDRRQHVESKAKMAYQAGKNNWEVETPYLARNSKKMTFLSAIKAEKEKTSVTAIANTESKAEDRGFISKEDLSKIEVPKILPKTSAELLLPSIASCKVGESTFKMKEIEKSNFSDAQSYSNSGVQLQNLRSLPNDNEVNERKTAPSKSTNSEFKVPPVFTRSERDQQLKAPLFKSTETHESSYEYRPPLFQSSISHESSHSSTFSENIRKPLQSYENRPKQSSPYENTKSKIPESSKETVTDNSSSIEEMDGFINKKANLMKEIEALESQRSILQEQKTSIIRNHKGDSSSLKELLKENSFLYNEIGKQINMRSDMVDKLNLNLVSLMTGKRTPEENFKSRSVERDQRHRSQEKDPLGYRYREKKKTRESPVHNLNYISSPKRSREYSKSPDYRDRKRASPKYRKTYSSPKRSRKYSRSPERTRRRYDSPDSYKRSPRRSERRSRSPKELKDSISPLPVPKIQDKHWAKSHIMGTLKKFKKELFSEVNLSEGNEASRVASNVSDTRGDSKSFESTNKKEFVKDSTESSHIYEKAQELEEKSISSKQTIETSEQVKRSEVEFPKVQIRYIDIGMHWCEVCDIVFENMAMYLKHLLSSPHLLKLKYDKKPWLAKAPKEEPKPVVKNAKIHHLPLMGVEFMHSLPVLYCSLCDVFLRDAGEGMRHPECEKHTDNFKKYRDAHPKKMNAYRVSHAAAVSRSKLSEDKPSKPASEIESQKKVDKLLREIKSKRASSSKQSNVSGNEDSETKSKGSVRVASRDQRPVGNKREKDAVSLVADKSYSQNVDNGDYIDSLSEDKQSCKLDKIKSFRRQVMTEEEEERKAQESKMEDRSSQDEIKKDSMISALKFPLFGKMPSLRKKQIGSTMQKGSFDMSSKLKISDSKKQEMGKHISHASQMFDKKKCASNSGNMQGQKSSLIPSNRVEKSTDGMIIDHKTTQLSDIVLPGEKTTMQADTVLPDSDILMKEADVPVICDLPDNMTSSKESELVKKSNEVDNQIVMTSPKVNTKDINEPEETADDITSEECSTDLEGKKHQILQPPSNSNEVGDSQINSEELGTVEFNDLPPPTLTEQERADSMKMVDMDIDSDEDDEIQPTVEAIKLLNIPIPGFEKAEEPSVPKESEFEQMSSLQETSVIPLPVFGPLPKNHHLDALYHDNRMKDHSVGNSRIMGSSYYDHSLGNQNLMLAGGSQIRETTPPPPGTEDIFELYEKPDFLFERSNTPPPPGTEPEQLKSCSSLTHTSNHLESKVSHRKSPFTVENKSISIEMNTESSCQSIQSKSDSNSMENIPSQMNLTVGVEKLDNDMDKESSYKPIQPQNEPNPTHNSPSQPHLTAEATKFGNEVDKRYRCQSLDLPNVDNEDDNEKSAILMQVALRDKKEMCDASESQLFDLEQNVEGKLMEEGRMIVDEEVTNAKNDLTNKKTITSISHTSQDEELLECGDDQDDFSQESSTLLFDSINECIRTDEKEITSSIIEEKIVSHENKTNVIEEGVILATNLKKISPYKESNIQASEGEQTKEFPEYSTCRRTTRAKKSIASKDTDIHSSKTTQKTVKKKEISSQSHTDCNTIDTESELSSICELKSEIPNECLDKDSSEDLSTKEEPDASPELLTRKRSTRNTTVSYGSITSKKGTKEERTPSRRSSRSTRLLAKQEREEEKPVDYILADLAQVTEEEVATESLDTEEVLLQNTSEDSHAIQEKEPSKRSSHIITIKPSPSGRRSRKAAAVASLALAAQLKDQDSLSPKPSSLENSDEEAC